MLLVPPVSPGACGLPGLSSGPWDAFRGAVGLGTAGAAPVPSVPRTRRQRLPGRYQQGPRRWGFNGLPPRSGRFRPDRPQASNQLLPAARRSMRLRPLARAALCQPAGPGQPLRRCDPARVPPAWIAAGFASDRHSPCLRRTRRSGRNPEIPLLESDRRPISSGSADLRPHRSPPFGHTGPGFPNP